MEEITYRDQCDYCGKVILKWIDLYTHIDVYDPEEVGDEGEFACRLCSHCYNKWLVGKVSTRRLIHTYERMRKHRLLHNQHE